MRIRSRHIAPLLLVAACGSDSVLDPDDRPEPPPAASLDADFSFFEGKTPGPGGTSSWTQAIGTVDAARTDMAPLRIPHALVAAATAGQGQRDGNAWVWTYSTTVDGIDYDGYLRAIISGSQYEWDLVATAPDHAPPLEDYLWAKAFVAPNLFQGLWGFANVDQAGDSLVAQASWIVNLEGGINFAFSASDSAGWRYERSANGNVLTYVVFNQARARVTWFPDGTGNTWTIATSTSCWNEELNDVAC